MVLPNSLSQGLLAQLDTSFGGTDKFDRGGTGKEGSGGFLAETAGENDALGGQQALRGADGALTDNILDASYFGFDSNEMRGSSNKLKFFWSI